MNNTIEYQEYPNANREYKSTLFVMCFKKKEDLLDLYNAVNGTDYQDPNDLEITTLDSAIYLTYKNVVSFLLGGIMNLYEHQSTYNPNMPIRGLLYFARLFEKFITKQNLDIYNSTLQKLPTPRYIVFYNGTREQPDKTILRLSDAFLHKDSCLECKVTMLNINYGRNKELMEKCKRLEEYSYFIGRVKILLAQSYPLTDAINRVMDECINQNILKDILTQQRAEVLGVLLSTFNKELYEKGLKDNAYNEGLTQGRTEGAQDKLYEQIRKKIAKGKSVEEIAEELEESVEAVKELAASLSEVEMKTAE